MPSLRWVNPSDCPAVPADPIPSSPPLPEGSPGKPLTGARAVAPKGAPEAVLGQCASYLLDTPPKPVPLTPEDRRPRGASDRKAFHRRSGILSNPCATTLP